MKNFLGSGQSNAMNRPEMAEIGLKHLHISDIFSKIFRNDFKTINVRIHLVCLYFIVDNILCSLIIFCSFQYPIYSGLLLHYIHYHREHLWSRSNHQRCKLLYYHQYWILRCMSHSIASHCNWKTECFVDTPLPFTKSADVTGKMPYQRRRKKIIYCLAEKSSSSKKKRRKVGKKKQKKKTDDSIEDGPCRNLFSKYYNNINLTVSWNRKCDHCCIAHNVYFIHLWLMIISSMMFQCLLHRIHVHDGHNRVHGWVHWIDSEFVENTETTHINMCACVCTCIVIIINDKTTFMSAFTVFTSLNVGREKAAA